MVKNWLQNQVDTAKEAAEEKQATKESRRQAIEELNIAYDTEAQVHQLLPYVRPQERLRAVYDLKGMLTGFIGITDKRVIIADTLIGKRKAMVTVPFNKITRVASENYIPGFFSKETTASSTLTVFVGGESYEFEFRGAEKAQAAYELIVDAIL